MLEKQHSWNVCAEAINGREAVHKVVDLHPDVAIIDFKMPEMNGLEASRIIMRDFPETKIVMLTVDPSEELMDEAKKVGVRGFCPKARLECVIDAVQATLRGQTHYTAA